MSEPDADADAPRTLEYGTAPPSPPPTQIFASLCGFGIAVLALLAGSAAVYVLIDGLLYANRRDRPGDLIAATVLILIALVCSYWAARWLRDAFRRRSDDGIESVVRSRRD
jgi:hypothetical protein